MGKKSRAAPMFVLGVTALAAFAKAPGAPSTASSDEELRYQTRCSAVSSDTVDGYVSNGSQDLYQVRGNVRFTFVQANSMSRRDILVQTDDAIPAGETVRVARAQLTFVLRPDERCFFDVAQAIRKQ